MASTADDMDDLQIKVGHFFATPVAAAFIEDADRRNADLKQRILAERAQASSIEASNMGGWHSGRPMSQWGGPYLDGILVAARKMADQMTLDRSGNAVRWDWGIRAWANVNEYGHANEFHYHPGVYWSGTYYVDDGGRAEDEALGGEFEIMDPRGPGVAMYAPSLVIADGGANTGGSTVRFTPRAGLLTLFPAWLSHQVRPYLGSTQRISIAFNLGLGDHRPS